ncbi:MAG TPA: MerR family transcriptional regulator [Terriglobales bacterium]|nr:MerR family transcriptional regulator [Terriglobales bacterium]
MKRQFTTSEVVKLTGITGRQLQWWDERGLVTPSRQGHRRIYSWDQLVTAAVINQLRRRGFSLQRMRKVIAFLEREFGTSLAATVRAASEYHLLTDGTHLYLRTSARQVVDLLKNSSQPMFDICLSDEVRRVRGQLLAGNAVSLKQRPESLKKSSASERVRSVSRARRA